VKITANTTSQTARIVAIALLPKAALGVLPQAPVSISQFLIALCIRIHALQTVQL